MFCPQCGASNPDNTRYCASCGAMLGEDSAFQYNAAAETPKCSNTGMLVWSIITTVFFGVLFGLIALVNAISAPKQPTAELQEEKLKASKTWNIVGTVIGVVFFIIRSSGII